MRLVAVESVWFTLLQVLLPVIYFPSLHLLHNIIYSTMWLFIQFLLTPIFYTAMSVIFNSNYMVDNFKKDGPTSSDYYQKYSSEERHALENFRPLVMEILDKDYENTDPFLIRWLRASDLDLLAANKMLREAKLWRKQNRMDTILNETTIVDMFKGPPCILEGIDRKGNPLAIVSLIGHDIRKLVVAGYREKMVRYMNQFLEKTESKIRELAKSTGKDINQAVTLVDAYGFSVKQHTCYECLKMYVEFLRNFEKFYPELNRYVVIINAPSIAKPFIETLRPVFSKNSQRAVKVFGVDRKEWSEFLLNIIAPDQLPSQFGGKKLLKLH